MVLVLAVLVLDLGVLVLVLIVNCCLISRNCMLLWIYCWFMAFSVIFIGLFPVHCWYNAGFGSYLLFNCPEPVVLLLVHSVQSM